jgi:hypothetical protein
MEKAPETPTQETTAQPSQQEVELNPEAAAWFKEYPDVEDAMGLERA